MLPLGKYLPHIAPADAMVIKLLFKACIQKSQNTPSTKLIKARGYVKSWMPQLKLKISAIFF
jgi:hypothetical protein